MDNTAVPSLIEYRVLPVTRYIVTRYEGHGPGLKGNAPREHGEFPNVETAMAVGHALCKAEHDRLGWPIGDERIQYPRDPRHGDARNANDLHSYAMSAASQAA